MLLLPPPTIRSATSCSTRIYPGLRFCKASGAEYAILAEGRKTEAINHKPLPHFLLYRDRMKRAVHKTTARYLRLRLSPGSPCPTRGSPGWKPGKGNASPPQGCAPARKTSTFPPPPSCQRHVNWEESAGETGAAGALPLPPC